ncbi:hypothetical protein [Demequina sediminicola]|uniref:hypothetical protein n=1 Tax=Demequina sediminicola TaxID=1095026 RepID=UPI000783F969|nr:hypothetical protein [Demequina sediminicola]
MTEGTDARSDADSARADVADVKYPEGIYPVTARIPDWAGRFPAPPGMPQSDLPLVETDDARWGVRWARGLVAGMALGALGAVLYVSLHILVGWEIYPTAVVIGVLAGAGLRSGGVRRGVTASAVSMVLALVFLWLGAVVGRVSAAAVATAADPRVALYDALVDPLSTTAGLFDEPLIALVAVMLALCGAATATHTYARRRSQREVF